MFKLKDKGICEIKFQYGGHKMAAEMNFFNLLKLIKEKTSNSVI